MPPKLAAYLEALHASGKPIPAEHLWAWARLHPTPQAAPRTADPDEFYLWTGQDREENRRRFPDLAAFHDSLVEVFGPMKKVTLMARRNPASGGHPSPGGGAEPQFPED